MKSETGRRKMLSRKSLSMIAKSAVCVCIFWVLFTRIDMSEVFETLSGARIHLIAVAILINLCGVLTGVYRWKISLAAQNLNVPLGMILNATLVSRFIGLLFPNFIGGDAVRGYDIFRYARKGVNVVASILFERIFGLIALVVIGTCALFLGMKDVENLSLTRPFLFVYVVLVLLIAGCFSRAITELALSVLDRVPGFHWAKGKLKGLSEAIILYRGHPGVWGSVLALSLFFQVLGILFYYVISLSLSIHAPLIVFCILIPIINLVTMTPVSPGGLGVKEGMFVVLFTQYGVPAAESLSIALVGTALYMVIILMGAIVYLTRPGIEKGGE
jgi:uncharacterized protein (TIRG00374 family)